MIIPDPAMQKDEIVMELKLAGVIPESVPDENIEIVFKTVVAPAARRQEAGPSTEAEIVIQSSSQTSMQETTSSINTGALPTDYTLTLTATSETSSLDASIIDTTLPGFKIDSISYDGGPNQWVITMQYSPDVPNVLISPFLSKVNMSAPYSQQALDTFNVGTFPCSDSTSVCCMNDYVDKYVTGGFYDMVKSSIGSCNATVLSTNTKVLFDSSAHKTTGLATIFANYPKSSIEFPDSTHFVMRIFTDDITSIFGLRIDRLDGTYQLSFSVGLSYYQLLPAPSLSTSVSQTTININVSPSLVYAFTSDTAYNYIEYITLSLLNNRWIDSDFNLQNMQFARLGFVTPSGLMQNMNDGLVPLTSIRYSISETTPDRTDLSKWTNPCMGTGGLFKGSYKQMYDDASAQQCAYHYDLCTNPSQEVLLSRLTHFAFPIGNNTISESMFSVGSYKLFITFEISTVDSGGSTHYTSVFTESTIKTTSQASSCENIESEMSLSNLISVNVSVGLTGSNAAWDASIDTVTDIMYNEAFTQNNSVDLGINHKSLANSMITLMASSRPVLANSRDPQGYYVTLDHLTSMHFLDEDVFTKVMNLMKIKTQTGTSAYEVSVDPATQYSTISFTSAATDFCFDADVAPMYTCGVKTSVVAGKIADKTHVVDLTYENNHTSNDYDPPIFIAQNLLKMDDFSLELGKNMTSLVRQRFSLDNYMRRGWFVNPGFAWSKSVVGSDMETLLTMSDKVLILAVMSLRETGTGRLTARRLLSVASDPSTGEMDVTDKDIDEQDFTRDSVKEVEENIASTHSMLKVGDKDNSSSPSVPNDGDDSTLTPQRRLLGTPSLFDQIAGKPIKSDFPSLNFNANVGAIIASILDIGDLEWSLLSAQMSVTLNDTVTSSEATLQIVRAVKENKDLICPTCTSLIVTSAQIGDEVIAITSRRLLSINNLRMKFMVTSTVPIQLSEVKLDKMKDVIVNKTGFGVGDIQLTILEQKSEVAPPPSTPSPPSTTPMGCTENCSTNSPTTGLVITAVIIFILIIIPTAYMNNRKQGYKRVEPITDPVSNKSIDPRGMDSIFQLKISDHQKLV